MNLSLDIMLLARAFAVLARGAAFVDPLQRGCMDLAGVYDQGRSTGWITRTCEVP